MGIDPGKGIHNDLSMIKGQALALRQDRLAISHVEPPRLRSVVTGLGPKPPCVNANGVGRGNRPAPGVAAWRTVDTHQVQRQPGKARFLLELPSGRLLDGFALIGKAARQRPAAQERMSPAADQQQLQSIAVLFKYGDVGCQRGLWIVLRTITRDGLCLGQATLVS